MSRWMTPFWWACWIAWQIGNEQLQALAETQLVLLAILGNGDAVDHLHDEIKPAGRGRAGVERTGDIGVIH